MEISSIDDLLMGGKSTQHTNVSENQPEDSSEDIELDEDITVDDEPGHDVDSKHVQGDDIDDDSSGDDDEPTKKEDDTDEYGNKQEPENEVIRDRLARQARKHQAEIDTLRSQLSQQGASQQVQQAAKDFEYNPDDSGDWQQQLAGFVKQTVNSMTREQQDNQTRQLEQQQQNEFESKFRTGMNKFNDFTDVIDSLSFQISDPMTLASRSMSDPASFFYAAAKQQPQELERISKIKDPYAQMAEIGRLEERMRRNNPTTKAPRPLGRTHEDATSIIAKKKTEPTIEDLIAKSDASKLKRLRARSSGGRR